MTEMIEDCGAAHRALPKGCLQQGGQAVAVSRDGAVLACRCEKTGDCQPLVAEALVE